MKKILRPVLLILGLSGAIVAAWRIASRIRPMPSPPWLGWMLENPLAQGIRADLLVERANIQPGMKVLDAGCGPGRVAVAAAKAAGPKGEVVAMDIQPAMLDMARRRAKNAGLSNIRFMLSPIGEDMLTSNRFDRAFLVAVLGEIPNRQQALKEIADSLKAEGIVSITEIVADPHFHTRHTLREMAKKAGLEEIQSFGNSALFTLNFRKPAIQAAVVEN